MFQERGAGCRRTGHAAGSRFLGTRASGNPTEAKPSPGMQQVAPQAGKPGGNPPGVSGDLRGGNEATGDQGKRQKASRSPRVFLVTHALPVRTGQRPKAPSTPAPPPRTGIQGGPGRKPRFSPSAMWPGVRLSRQPEQPVGTLPSRAKPRGLVCRSQSKNSKDFNSLGAGHAPSRLLSTLFQFA